MPGGENGILWECRGACSKQSGARGRGEASKHMTRTSLLKVAEVMRAFSEDSNTERIL